MHRRSTEIDPELVAEQAQIDHAYDCLERSRLPLVRDGMTRFGERLTDGIIVDTADGSIDELLARASDDWVYAEWLNGGAVATIQDESGSQYAGPPTMLDAIREFFKN